MMQKIISGFLTAAAVTLAGCAGGPPNAVNTARVNTNAGLPANSFNTNTNTAANIAPNAPSGATIDDTREPEQYQAVVKLSLQATTAQNGAAELPAISANVARSGADRRMEFNLPTAEKVVYLEKAGTTYLILPNRRQYATLDRQAVGFEVRSLMMPEQIVNQVKAVRGVERIGEENVFGRTVVKYRYGAVSDTPTAAGRVATESYFLIDKETGLPLRSETVSQSQNGNVQGYRGLRVVTEMSDIKTEAAPELFALPAGFTQIDAAEVRAQAELIFNAVGLLLSRALETAPAAANSNANANR